MSNISPELQFSEMDIANRRILFFSGFVVARLGSEIGRVGYGYIDRPATIMLYVKSTGSFNQIKHAQSESEVNVECPCYLEHTERRILMRPILLEL